MTTRDFAPTRPSGRRSAARPADEARPSARSAARGSRRPPEAAIRDRILPACILILFLYVCLIGRLFFLQVLRHEEFARLARSSRERSKPLRAQRGVLYDRQGTLLVRNEPAYDVTLDPNMWYAHPNPDPKAQDTPASRAAKDVDGLSACLPGVDVRGILAKNPPTQFKTSNGTIRYRTLTIARQVDAAAGEKIKAMGLGSVGLLGTFRREAVDGDLASHVLGYCDRDGQGIAGLEASLDGVLAGEDGRIAAEFDTQGREIPGTARTTRLAQPGRDLVLTLDADLQHVVQQALIGAVQEHRAEAGTAVVLDPRTGDILALANCPTYNVNDVAKAGPTAQINRAVALPYEPGSTLKAITVAAALEQGFVSMDSSFHCVGKEKIGRWTIHCAEEHPFEHGHGQEKLLDVVKNSCNVATARIAFQIGKRTLCRYEQLFGFGAKPESGLPGEVRGALAPAEKWSDIQLANVAFGQGISVTPLQLAAAYAAIANDGVYLRPRIVLGSRDPETEQIHSDPVAKGRRVISPQTARLMQQMLQAVVDGGTGRPAQLDGYTAGGKTGTAQIAEGRRYGGKFVSSFVGMAPMTGTPRYVVLVAIRAPRGDHYGGSVCGPVFKEIMEKALLAARVPHDRVEKTPEQRRRERGGASSRAGVAEA